MMRIRISRYRRLVAPLECRSGWVRLLLSAGLVVGLLAGCASQGEDVGTGADGDGNTEDGGGDVSDAGLSGEWTIEEITIDGSMIDLPTGVAVTLAFSDGRVSGDSGCNSFGGTYRVDDDRLLITELAVTGMACEDDRAAIQTQVLGVFGASPRFERDSSRLAISADSVTLRYQLASPVADAALVGTEWQLSGFIEGSTASTRPGVDRVRLVFSAAGSLGGNAGCNALKSSWEIDGDALTIGDVAVTRMSCGPEADAVEQLVLGILGDADRFEIGGTRLLVWAGDRALDFGAALSTDG